MPFPFDNSSPPAAISITAICKDNPSCVFDGSDILIETALKNSSNSPIGIPVEFLKQQGAYCTLIDNQTHRNITLRVSGAPEFLLDKFTQIPPGEAVKVTSVVSAASIYQFGPEFVDLTAKLGIGIPIRFSPNGQPTYFNGSTTLRIVVKENLHPKKQ